MAVMRTVGNGHALPPHAHVREEDCRYVVELDVSDFTQRELTVEALGPIVTVRGEQTELKEDEGLAFRVRERLEESFRLPDDVDPDGLTVRYRHGLLEIHVPRRRLARREVPVESASAFAVNPDAAAC
jgi:HSP20 family protein